MSVVQLSQTNDSVQTSKHVWLESRIWGDLSIDPVTKTTINIQIVWREAETRLVSEAVIDSAWCLTLCWPWWDMFTEWKTLMSFKTYYFGFRGLYFMYLAALIRSYHFPWVYYLTLAPGGWPLISLVLFPFWPPDSLAAVGPALIIATTTFLSDRIGRDRYRDLGWG